MTLLRLERADGTELGESTGSRARDLHGQSTTPSSAATTRLRVVPVREGQGTDYSAPGTFVAAFAQSNSGDVSPNIYGGEMGEGADDFESTQASGQKQLARPRSSTTARASSSPARWTTGTPT
jgi:neutral ceramidase